MDTKETIAGFFNDFVFLGAKAFYDEIINVCSYWYNQPISKDQPLEEFILNLSSEALARARNIEELAPGDKASDWRCMSFLLRKAAHKLFRNFNSESTHEGFLRLIK